jgi:two-component system cell cycle sensor histidine kinase/response regulator CckA
MTIATPVGDGLRWMGQPVLELRSDDLLDRLTESVTAYDRDGRLRYINAAGARLFSRPASDLLGRQLREVAPVDPGSPFQRGLREVLDGGPGRTVVTFAKSLQRWFEIDIHPIPEGALVIARDVTQRTLAEEQLKQSEARFRAMVEYAPEAIAIMDADTGRFVGVNPGAERLFGLAHDALLSKGPTDLCPPTQPGGASSTELAMRYTREAVDGGTPEFEWTIRNGRGEDVPCEVRLLRLPSSDRVLIRGSVTDISSRKRMQEQLAQAQRLEAIGRLAGGVAHDFNNILAVILGTAEVLLRRLSSDHPIRTELADIVGAAERATLVTRQLLAFGRKQRLAPHLVDLGDHVEHMSRMLQRLLGTEIELDLELVRPIGPVRVDPGQIEQVVLNLVVNARDAMPGGGRVSIGTAEVTLPGGHERADESVPPGRYVVLSVTDTGTGMTEAIRAHIFEPFFTTKELGRGTGLGLSTVHGIVEQSGGCIRVTSESGTGTTFRVYLPRVDDARG